MPEDAQFMNRVALNIIGVDDRCTYMHIEAVNNFIFVLIQTRKMLQILLGKRDKRWAPLMLQSLRDTQRQIAQMIEETCYNFTSIRPSSAH